MKVSAVSLSSCSLPVSSGTHQVREALVVIY
jgi:hypothetical protein